MAIYKETMVQRGHSFAIVDEVDSILIDEARTPLIISGQGEASSELYTRVDEFVSRLKKKVYASIDEKQAEDEDLDADYVVDEKARSATLTAHGIAKAESYFGLDNLADIENSTISHHINQAIRAHGVMKRDIDYVVKDGEVIIVDEFTGRLMLGRRYSEGLHQAIEAKEHVEVANENKTLATITFQNYFRLYDKLSGMTGTAATEAEEFAAIYKLDIVEIPTNKPMARIDHNDALYRNEQAKNRAVIQQILDCHAKGQPVLVGTVSIEKSEYLSGLLKRAGVPDHNVLNAKNHEREAEIVAQAGKLGAVTIATNMAGRGTDIMLGGNAEFMARRELKKAGYDDEIIAEAVGHADTDNEEILSARAMFNEKEAEFKKRTAAEAEQVKAAGGLFIIGTERHESRRIDNQLRGRAGRQGDPGESRFYVALTDDIMRLFGSERIMRMMDATMDEDVPIDFKIMSSGIEQAQKNVESRNFQSRKSVLEFDDVMNVQRNTIYSERRRVLDGENIKDNVKAMVRDYVAGRVAEVLEDRPHVESAEQLSEIVAPFQQLFLRPGDIDLAAHPLESLTPDVLTELVLARADQVYEEREAAFGISPRTGKPLMREIEQVVVLGVVDQYWMEHIDAMDELRRGIGLRAFGNTKPVDAYKEDGFAMFEEMIEGIKAEVARRIYTVRVQTGAEVQRKAVAKTTGENAGGGPVKRQPIHKVKKPGRNDPCPCGSGKKYKKCCGRFEN
jgi:preprotein translocase subunit SecA